MSRRYAKYLVLFVQAIILASFISPATRIQAGWSHLSGQSFLTEQVCRDGMRFGFAAFSAGSFSVKADRNTGHWFDSHTLVLTQTMVLPIADPPAIVDPGAEAGGFFSYSHAGYYAFRWTETLAVGTELKIRIDYQPDVPEDGIMDPRVQVQDCLVFDLVLSASDSPDPVSTGGPLRYTLLPRNIGSAVQVAPSRGFANTTKVEIPGSGAAMPYPSTINVSGLEGTVTKVSVTLQNFTHPAFADLDILLVGPNGRKVILASDAGVNNSVGFEPVTFDDEAPSPIPDDENGPIGFHNHQPANYDGGDTDTFAAPAPTGPYATALSALDGSDPNGTWSLYIVDDSAADSRTGKIEGGWSLSITTNAVRLTVRDTLQAGVTFVNASGTNWTCTPNQNIVTCIYIHTGTEAIPDISFLVKAPNTPGSIENTVTATSGLSDPNTTNNTATITTQIKFWDVLVPLVMN